MEYSIGVDIGGSHIACALIDLEKNEIIRETLTEMPVDNQGEDWVLEHLPTHRTHLYDVHRYTFKNEISIETAGKCHGRCLVEGSSIKIHTKSGYSTIFNYAETFIVPAASEAYTIENESGSEAKLIKTFVK